MVTGKKESVIVIMDQLLLYNNLVLTPVICIMHTRFFAFKNSPAQYTAAWV